jgi:hypothetical protein
MSTVVICQVIDIGAGNRAWIPVAMRDDKGHKTILEQGREAIFMMFGTGEKADLRKVPPFIQILPCPYCGVTEDRGHHALSHVDHRLGTLI